MAMRGASTNAVSEPISRRHIGRARAVADDDTKANAPEVGAAAGRKIAGLLQLAHQWRRGDDEVSRKAGADDRAKLPGGPDGELELLARLARVVIDDLRNEPAHRAGRSHFQIGRSGGGRQQRGRKRNQRQNAQHGSSSA
jgi:hypothetical protein